MKITNSLHNIKYTAVSLVVLIFFTCIITVAQSQVQLDSLNVKAQMDTLKLQLPEGEGWKVGSEEEEFTFSLQANRPDSVLTYSMKSPKEAKMNLSKNQFSWTPSKNLVSKAEGDKTFIVLLRVTDGIQKDSAFVELLLIDKPEEVIPKDQLPKISALEFPLRGNWKLLHEGDTLEFAVKAKTNNGKQYGIHYSLEEGDRSSIQFDSAGNFFWVPEYDYVTRLQEIRDKHLFIVAEDAWGNVVSEKIVLSVFHQNRNPVIKNLKAFHVLSRTKNTYKISERNVKDPDGDPIVFVTEKSDLPSGVEFTSSGRITWTPSRNQFNALRQDPIKIPFFVEDQPDKGRTLGYLTIEASRQDMPPEFAVIPSDTALSIDENETLHLVFNLSDPNGDDDVEQFGFVSNDPRIESKQLRKNTNNNYEFIWTPSYNFVNDPDPFIDVELRFFVIDKSSKSSSKTIYIKVNDAEDLAKKDAENSELYKETLMETLNLMDQLSENQKHLDKELKLAKKGKKNRSLISAAIGAITGLSPVITKTPDSQKTISVIGGTSTLTLGSLEAKDVIGKSVNATNNKIKINTELYNQFLSEGTSFARRYNSKLNRRNTNFSYDVEKLKKIINSPRISELALDANWQNKKKLNNRRLKSTFTEYDIIDND